MDYTGVRMLLFDLDGTLIDSVEGIYDCYLLAMSKIKVTPVSKLGFRSSIGASFDKMICKLHEDLEENTDLSQKAISVFRKNYDSIGFKNYRVYEGIKDLLEYLHRSGLQIGIVSNKKNIQVEEILNENFGEFKIQPYGKLEDLKWSKEWQTKKIKSQHKIVAFTGDTEEDRKCALAANSTFVYAKYGYGIVKGVNKKFTCNNIYELQETLQRIIL